MKPTPFFSVLGALAGSQQQENQLSRTFKACFDNSVAFQHLFIDFIADKAKKSGKAVRTSVRWTCHVEQAVQGQLGRLDLHFRAVDGRSEFSIESKVESPLTEQQLRKYRRGGVRQLFVMTKYPAEVSDRRLQKLGIVAAIRWQEVHSLLRTRRPRSGSDRFLCDAFADYLEEAQMAYPTGIAEKDLEHMATVLRAVGSDSDPVGRPSQAGFETAAGCLALLSSLAKKLRDARPDVFETAAQWGPRYCNEEDEDGRYHYLWLELYRRPRRGKVKRTLSVAIAIPQKSGPVAWTVWHRLNENDYGEPDWHPLKRVGVRKGVLDEELLLANVLKFVKQENVRL